MSAAELHAEIARLRELVAELESQLGRKSARIQVAARKGTAFTVIVTAANEVTESDIGIVAMGQLAMMLAHAAAATFGASNAEALHKQMLEVYRDDS